MRSRGPFFPPRQATKAAQRNDPDVARGKGGELEVEGRRIPVSSLEKLLYPSFTKAQVIDYYIRVSQWLLPHLHDRPVTLKRYPDGIGSEHFYEKDAPSFTPSWIKTFPVPRRAGGKD